MSTSLILLLTITFLYAGYNLLIKVSSGYANTALSSTILATITLQFAAIAVSILFALTIIIRGGNVLTLPGPAYWWAAAAGVCIGAAEILYFYLFRGMLNIPPIAASVAIPFIVSGTIVVSIFVAWFVFNETLSWQKLLGMAFVVGGVALIYLDRTIQPQAI